MPQVLAGDEVRRSCSRRRARSRGDGRRRDRSARRHARRRNELRVRLRREPARRARPRPDPACRDAPTARPSTSRCSWRAPPAFFSADQTPLTSRSVRFLSDVHFPPGIATPRAAALFGIENTNRGCSFDAARRARSQTQIPRARSLLRVRRDGLPCAARAARRQMSGCTTGIATLPGRRADLQERPHGRRHRRLSARRHARARSGRGGGRSHGRPAPRRPERGVHARRVRGARLRRRPMAFPTIVPKGLPASARRRPGSPPRPPCCAERLLPGILPARRCPSIRSSSSTASRSPRSPPNPPVTGVGTGTLDQQLHRRPAGRADAGRAPARRAVARSVPAHRLREREPLSAAEVETNHRRRRRAGAADARRHPPAARRSAPR